VEFASDFGGQGTRKTGGGRVGRPLDGGKLSRLKACRLTTKGGKDSRQSFRSDPQNTDPKLKLGTNGFR